MAEKQPRQGDSNVTTIKARMTLTSRCRPHKVDHQSLVPCRACWQTSTLSTTVLAITTPVMQCASSETANTAP